MTNGSIAVSFILIAGQLMVFNALDENGLELDPPGPNYRRHLLAP